MPKIVIFYRRADSDAITDRILDRLIAHYGREAIFRDIDDIPPGVDFRQHIDQTLVKTNVLLAIVGPNWLGITNDGRHRINEETDSVRVEIETALRRRMPLIPILIDNEEKNWDAYNVQAWPTTILIDKHGRIRNRWEGELNADGSGLYRQVQARIEALRREKA